MKDLDFKQACFHTGVNGQHMLQECLLSTSDGARRLRVQISVPVQSSIPPEGLPVLFMLDGNAVFDQIQQSGVCSGGVKLNVQTGSSTLLHSGMDLSSLLVVGIGYDTTVTAVADGRAYDYTPSIPGICDLRDPRVFERRAGGADTFMQTVKNAIWPAIRERYPVREDAVVLYGHSYGGLCVLHTLFSQPSMLFTRWIAVSPSLWWHDRYLLKEADQFINHSTMSFKDIATRTPNQVATHVVLMAGTQEQLRQKPVGVDGITAANRPQGIPTSPWVKDLAGQLASVDGLDARFIELPGADHKGALHMSIPEALTLMRQWFLSEQ